MQPEELAKVIVIGAVLMVLGLVPGLFDRLRDAIQSFRDSLFSPFPTGVPQGMEYEKHPRPLWLTVVGLALILISVVGLLVKLN